MEKAFLFDLEGVIIEGKSTARENLEKAVAEALKTQEKIDRVINSLNSKQAFIEICNALNREPEDLWRDIMEKTIEKEMERVKEERPLKDGAEKVLRSECTGIVSNNYIDFVENVKEFYNLEADILVGKKSLDDQWRKKPDPYLVKKAFNSLNADSGFYVGDRRTDVQAANATGLNSVYIGQKKVEKADFCFNSLEEFRKKKMS